MQLRSFGLLLIAMSASFSVAGKGQPTWGDTFATVRSEQSGYAAVGSPLHSWMSRQVSTGHVADFVTFEFNYGGDTTWSSGAPVAAILSDTTVRKDDLVPEGDPPSGGGRLGSTQQTKSECGYVVVGGSPTPADITYSWSYQYTRDSNGDGKKDSDPAWVLVGASYVFLDMEQVNQCG